ncbi:hypothetical protein DUNSADRAFT_5705 [Dunaliella salina]|uniref:DUF7876 domain-containing protein n=1 Tax=Dunaliella salina TaxID=3046 RepID=A0ABQ7GPX1_DUNSA|nr:hypothetical protein DUNSADRAFT_5705 [Dunaliella salina]|eukprot:KAF5836588.1 hypothetical protein DUNSADRAFT_5705 [Dunaliella salina]
MQLSASVSPYQTQQLPSYQTRQLHLKRAPSSRLFLQKATPPPCSSSQSNRLLARTTSGSTSVLPVPRLIQYYNEVQHPARANRRYSLCISDFVNEAIQAFACGFNEVQLEKEVAASVKKQQEDNPGSMQDFDQEDCIRCIMIVWTTLVISPKTVRRWAIEKPISDATFKLWRGFCTMIVSAYFERRMAWFPIDRLSMELAASQDLVETHDRVAERARIVFTVLETVYPQFPSA